MNSDRFASTLTMDIITIVSMMGPLTCSAIIIATKHCKMELLDFKRPSSATRSSHAGLPRLTSDDCKCH